MEFDDCFLHALSPFVSPPPRASSSSAFSSFIYLFSFLCRLHSEL